MKQLTVIFLIFLSLTTFGQQQQKPTLDVTGTARVNVTPDLGILSISVSEIKATMSDAIKALGDKSSHYNDLLIRLGFSDKEIKTTSFTVSKNRVYRDRDYIDSGYVASQNIRLQFTYSQQLLQKIVAEFSKSDQPIDFSFDFELSEQLKQKVQSQIIEYAVKDANEKANTIAKASGQKLIRIMTITYSSSWGNNGGMELIEQKHRYAATAAPNDDFQSFNFTPDDLTFRDNITVEWSIE